MKRFAAAVFAAFVLLGSGLALPVQARDYWTREQLEKMEHKAKNQLYAYQRYEMSEREAVQDGMPEQAALYRQAKDKALEAYKHLNAQYQKALSERREYDRKTEMATER
ncbi:hypothetical protein JCM15519_30730 [Fundidesulfovibrio butyratiphilus]